MRNPCERLRDIIQAASNIERYLVRGKESFVSDELLQTWMLYQIQIVGEAARALPSSVRERAPDVPWNKIIGMRHVLVHGYFQIDTELVWEAASREIPVLKERLERLLCELERKDRNP